MTQTTSEEIAPSPTPRGFTVGPELLGDETETVSVGLPGVYPEDGPIPADRVALFYAEGKAYTVPRVVDPRIAFRFIRALKTRSSEELAMADMMYEVLGGPVIDALADINLDLDQLQAVMKAVTKYTMSTMNRAGLGN